MRQSKFLIHCAVVLCCYGIIFQSNSINSCQINEIPRPTWLTKSPLQCKPSSDWWKTGSIVNPLTYPDEREFAEKFYHQGSDWVLQYKDQYGEYRWAACDQGTFSLMDLQTLNQEIADQQPINDLPELSVIVPDPWTPWETDIRYLQSVPCLKHAAFCIETSSQPLNNGIKRLHHLVCLRTQAANAQIATAGATFSRTLLAPCSLNKQPLSENPIIGIHRDIAVLSGYGDDTQAQYIRLYTNPNGTVNANKSQLITHLFCPQLEELCNEHNGSQESQIEKLSIYIETIIKASIYAKSHELIMPLDCPHLGLMAKALNQKNVIAAIKQWNVHLTLVYQPDHKNSSAKQDFAAFIDLLRAVDTIKATCYHTDRPIHLVVGSYLAWLYTYEFEKEYNAIKSETEAALHHLADQMNVLLKKLIMTTDILTDNQHTQQRPIVIISIPKAGNHLLGEAISLLTGKKILWPGDIQGTDLDTAIGTMDKDHFMFIHVAHRPADIEAIEKHNPILFFIYRDPRDLAVSFASFRRHWIHLDGKPRNDLAPLLTECITTLVPPWCADATKLHGMAGLYDAIMPWVTYPGICIVRFEDIVGEKGGGSAAKQRETIERVATHLGITNDDSLIDSVVQNIFGNGVTFRQGQIGSWKQYFSKTDIELLKQSMGQWLIDWKYEKDLNW